MDQMKRRNFVGQVAGIAGMVGVGAAAALRPTDAMAQVQPGNRLTIPFTAANGATGTLSITQFLNQGGQLVATGVATVTSATNTAGGITSAITSFTMPANVLATSTCDVLNLQLGPLHLSLLGLNIDLNQINLNITANPAGGLLGQLLCSLAGGGNGNGNAVQQLVNLLNGLLRNL